MNATLQNLSHTSKPATKEYFQGLLRQSGMLYERKERIKELIIPENLLNIFDKDTIEEYRIIPVGIENDGSQERLVLVTDLDANFKEIPLFEEMSKMSVNLQICDSDNIKEGILYHYNIRANLADTHTQHFSEVKKTDEESEVEKSEVRRKIENILKTAFNKGASDIYFHPGDYCTYVVIEIDGRLVNFSKEYPFKESDKSYVVNIIRTMCNLDSINKNMPGDGSFHKVIDNKNIDFRVSILPTIRGEKVVIRLLDPSKRPLDLDELGFPEEEKKLIKKIMMMPLGLFFVVGPVGTGKSTTIHAALNPMKGLDHNIITIENPAEYRDELLTQVQIREGAESNNLDGSLIFKASLRQAPKTFFVGETRDRKDAGMLITAALSGHRIVTTLHGIDALESLDRLYDMGVDKTALKLINGILAQRLIPKNCTKCSEIYELEEDEIMMLSEKELEYIQSGTPQKGKGCSHCNEGFSGRKVVAEIILFNNEFRDFLSMQSRGIIEIQKYLSEKHGFRTIWQKGLDLVKNGEIKLSQLIDVMRPNM